MTVYVSQQVSTHFSVLEDNISKRLRNGRTVLYYAIYLYAFTIYFCRTAQAAPLNSFARSQESSLDISNSHDREILQTTERSLLLKRLACAYMCCDCVDRNGKLDKERFLSKMMSSTDVEMRFQDEIVNNVDDGKWWVPAIKPNRRLKSINTGEERNWTVWRRHNLYMFGQPAGSDGKYHFVVNCLQGDRLCLTPAAKATSFADSPIRRLFVGNYSRLLNIYQLQHIKTGKYVGQHATGSSNSLVLTEEQYAHDWRIGN